MRLTLRTLLAYLDDILEPSQTKEIGAKVNESGYASMLVNRIREVMRRRRLTAPDLSGPEMGLDPNNVSEYLDNTLGPDAVADVEKVCLDSDVHLAEVAASHQILTLVLGEPVDVPASTRERMYALGPKHPSGSNGKQSAETESKGETKTVTGSSNKTSEPETATAGTGFDETIPEYLKPAPLWRRLGPVAVAVLVGAVWLWMVYFDPSLNNPRPGDNEVASTDGSDTAASTDGTNGPASTTPAPAGNTEPGTGTGTVPATTAPTETGPGTVATTTPANTFDNLPGVDPTPPPDSPDTTPATGTTTKRPGTPVASTTTPGTTTPGTTTPATATPATGNPTTPTTGTGTATPAVVPAPEMIYLSREGVLARKTKTGWMVMPGRTAIRVGDRIASPAPFKALLQLASLHLTIELQPDTAVEYLGATADVEAAFSILRGRVAVKRQAPDELKSPLKLGIRLATEDCQLAFTTPNVECGLEVTPRQPSKFEEDLSADPYVGSLFVIKGEASFQGKLTKPEMLSGPAWMPLGVKDRQALAAATARPPLLTTPDWLDPDHSGMSTTVRRYAVRFQKELDPDTPLEQSVPTVVSSPVPRLAEYAARTLVVTEQIPGMVETMSRAEFEEVRAAVITGIRQWLPQSEDNRELLKAELEKHFLPDQVDPIYRLLWGYDEADARNQVSSRLLVDWLGHDSVVIRQLAFLHIYRLTGQRYDYRPENPPNQRRVAVDRWEQHLRKNDDLLLK